MVARLSLLQLFLASQSHVRETIRRQVLRELGCHRDFQLRERAWGSCTESRGLQ